MKGVFPAFFCFLIVMIFFIIRCSNNKPAVEQVYYASLDSATSYVGMNTCKECHQSIYETFIRTGMGLSIDYATRKKTSANFSNHPRVYDSYRDFYYQPYWSDDSLRFLEFRLDGKDTVYKRTETIKYIIGSGQHTNSHIYNTNGYLNQAPLTYYTQSGQWDLPPGFEDGHNTRFERKIGLECLSCHNGYPQIKPGSENNYISVPTGIDCERCHGPGGKHVADKKAGKIIDVSKEIDYSIVNPAKLPIDLQFDVCQRCHIQGNAVLNPGKSFYDFKPGMKLSDVMNVFMPVYKGNEEEHIMASHAERLKQSKCFINTTDKIKNSKDKVHTLKPYENGLTCVTCHDPHVSRLETPKDKFNSACKNCHGNNDTGCKESHEKLQLESFNCVKCHMPENGTIDIPHVRVHDHKIRKPVAESEKKKIREFAGIAAINNPAPPSSAKAGAFINYFEKFGYDKSMLDSALNYLPHNSKTDVEKNFSQQVHASSLPIV